MNGSPIYIHILDLSYTWALYIHLPTEQFHLVIPLAY